MAFHTATFRLLKYEPRISTTARIAVGDAENRLGFSLPSSVRDWYTHDGAIQILYENSNQDPPMAVEDFAMVQWQSRTLIPIRHENQRVCTWAVAIDGSEDPAVFVEVDSGGKEWQLVAPTFSAYVFSCLWDYQQVLGRPALLQAQNAPLSSTAHDALAAAFTEELQTHGWPGSAQYRFGNAVAAILIWSGDEQADWFIGSSDAVSLESAARAVWDLDAVGPSLYECSQIGTAVLEKIRGMATSGSKRRRTAPAGSS